MSDRSNVRSRVVLYAIVGALAAVVATAIGGGTLARGVLTAIGVMALLTVVAVARGAWRRRA